MSAKMTEYETALERLSELSKDARRKVSGDIEWDAPTLRTVIDSTRTLCDAVDRHVSSIKAGVLSTARWPELERSDPGDAATAEMDAVADEEDG